ncbi:DUF1707 SHOCT-like domain-containing protein [Nocardioides massiliensis]|uniref:DUF1707 domain-containing protein n=1 Tax=Nocardioides massiliensis TaxID=1325935 RepID=A0ABT9NJZ3_9ACTN|nr:DUF1707 domain-containing protein [Nocardioides massiliensis]MDP9820735.1 hypothetical protein [Nocardioides massiliensis]
MGARTRARTADRDRAIDIINAAYADGQLGEIVRENRIEAALQATTLGQLRALTQDLQHPGQSGPAQPAAAARGKSPRPVRRDTTPLPLRAKLFLGGCAAVLVVATISGVLADRADEPSAGAPISFTISTSSLHGVRDAYEEQFATTETYRLTFSPEAVVAYVPTDDGRERYEEWRWNDGDEEGRFRQVVEARTAQGRFARVDLADVDIDRIEANMRRAEAEVGVEDPEEVSVWIEHPSYEDQAVVRIQVVNAYDELGYLFTDLAGEVLRVQRFGEE